MSGSFSNIMSSFLLFLVSSSMVNASYLSCSTYSCAAGTGNCYMSGSLFSLQAVCDPCSAGTYSSGGVGAVCTSCPSGSYSPSTSRSTTCYSCNGNNVNALATPAGSVYCNCISSYYSSGQNSCNTCTSGSYTSGNGITGYTCSSCPSNCATCYSNSNGVAVCTSCINGSNLYNGVCSV
jgi:hypothetical protein